MDEWSVQASSHTLLHRCSGQLPRGVAELAMGCCQCSSSHLSPCQAGVIIRIIAPRDVRAGREGIEGRLRGSADADWTRCCGPGCGTPCVLRQLRRSGWAERILHILFEPGEKGEAAAAANGRDCFVHPGRGDGSVLCKNSGRRLLLPRDPGGCSRGFARCSSHRRCRRRISGAGNRLPRPRGAVEDSNLGFALVSC